MKKINFWLVQIIMVAVVSLAFGSPVFAGPDKAEKAAKVSVGEEMRLEKANLGEGNAKWKQADVPDPEPTCEDFGLVGDYPHCF